MVVGNEKTLLAERIKKRLPGFYEEAAKELLHIFASEEFSVIEVWSSILRVIPRNYRIQITQQLFQIVCFGSFRGYSGIVPKKIDDLAIKLQIL